MYDLNECIRSLNVGLPDDIARLKAAGYYKEAIALSLIHIWKVLALPTTCISG